MKTLAIIEKARSLSFDGAGTATAIVCIIHCLILPIVLTAVPALTAYTELVEKAEIGILVSAFLLGGLSIYRGFFWHHHDTRVLALIVTGLSLLALGLFLPKPYSVISHSVAAATLITGHIWNGILCRKCQKCKCE